MKWYKIAPLLILLIFAGSAMAATCNVPGVGISPVVFTRAEYTDVCAKFTWTHDTSVDTEDFNNFIVRVVSDADNSIADYNTNDSSLNVCTVSEGETVQLFVMPFDGNKLGHYCGFDYNVSVTGGTVAKAASFFAYALLAAFGVVIGLAILVGVMLFLIKKTGIRIPGMKSG